MSFSEIMLILAIVLVFLGPEKIPEVAKFVGKTLREVRKASNLLRDAVMVDDLPETRRPRKQAVTYDEADEVETDYMRDPDPDIDLKIVAMNPRQDVDGLAEIALTTAKPELPLREVYLHIPYEETI